jgi:hypothetical protein
MENGFLISQRLILLPKAKAWNSFEEHEQGIPLDDIELFG